MFSCYNGIYDPHFSSIQFSCSVMTDSLGPHESQHARPPCPSQTPGVHSNSCPLSQWCHPAILSSVVPFSSCLQSLPASGSFPMSQLFSWGGQSTGVSASASPSNEHPGLTSFRMDWLDLLAVQGTLKSLLQHHSSKAPVFQHSAFFIVQLSHLYMTTGKTIALTRWTTLLDHNLKFCLLMGLICKYFGKDFCVYVYGGYSQFFLTWNVFGQFWNQVCWLCEPNITWPFFSFSEGVGEWYYFLSMSYNYW